MRRKSLIIALALTALTGISCSQQQNKDGQVKENQTTSTQNAQSACVITAKDLMDICQHNYELRNDYIKKLLSKQDITLIDINRFDDMEGVEPCQWYSEVWGHNMDYDSESDIPALGFSPTASDGIALIATAADNIFASVFFADASLQEKYIEELTNPGYRHVVEDDEYGNHFDAYIPKGRSIQDAGEMYAFHEYANGIIELELCEYY